MTSTWQVWHAVAHAQHYLLLQLPATCGFRLTLNLIHAPLQASLRTVLLYAAIDSAACAIICGWRLSLLRHMAFMVAMAATLNIIIDIGMRVMFFRRQHLMKTAKARRR